MIPPTSDEVISDLKARLRAFLARTSATAGPGACACANELGAAVGRLEHAIDDSTDGEAWSLLGAAHYQMGDLDHAGSQYETAISRNPCSIDGYLGLTRVYRQQRRPDDALSLLEQALGIDPDQPEAHLHTGILLG